MTKEEILYRYQKEKDEGKVFFNSKSLLKGYAMMVLIAMILMIMSFLLTGESTISDIIFILVLPFLFMIYGMKGYYLKNKTYSMISFAWLVTFCIKIVHFVSEFL